MRTIEVSSSFGKYEDQVCSEKIQGCPGLCDVVGRFQLAGMLFSIAGIGSACLLLMCLLHLVYLNFMKPIALSKAYLLHVGTSGAYLTACLVHFLVSRSLAVPEIQIQGGMYCTGTAMFIATVTALHFLYLHGKKYLGYSQVKYTELEGTRIGIEGTGRPMSEEVQFELTEPTSDDKKQHHVLKELEDLRERLDHADSQRATLMSDNQMLSRQVEEKEKSIRELETKVLRSQNNVQVTAALNLAKAKEEEVSKLLNRIHDLDEKNMASGKQIEELKSKMKEKEHVESSLRTEVDSQIQILTTQLEEAKTKAAVIEKKAQNDSESGITQMKERLREVEELNEAKIRETLSREKTIWNAEKQRLEDEARKKSDFSENLKAELRASKEELRNSENSLEILKFAYEQQVKELLEDKETSQSQVHSLTTDLQELETIIKDKDAEIDSIHRLAKETESVQVADLTTELHSLKNEFHREKEELARTQTKLSDLQSHVSKKETEFNALETAFSAAKTEAAGLKSEKEGLIRTLESVKRDKESMQQQIFSFISEQESASQTTSDLESKCAHLETNLKTLHNELESNKTKSASETKDLTDLLTAKTEELAKSIAKVSELTRQQNESSSNLLALLTEHEELKREKDALELLLQDQGKRPASTGEVADSGESRVK